MTPGKEGPPNHDADRKYLNKIVNEAWDKRQEGPPTLTLRKAREMARAIEWRKKPDPRFTFRCPYCLNNNLLGHNGACLVGKFAAITDEALERDEKRGAALEKLYKIVTQLGLVHFQYCSKYIFPTFRCDCDIKKLHRVLDALTPAPGGKK